jgi:glucose-6-phosphate 1-dehydrogenase
MYTNYELKSNYFRFRVSPQVVSSFGLNIIPPDNESTSQTVELQASRAHSAKEMDAYERVLTDAMAGDATLFAREDYVEEAWRIVDPVLKSGTPVHEYEPGTWGPAEIHEVRPVGGWRNPVVDAVKG